MGGTASMCTPTCTCASGVFVVVRSGLRTELRNRAESSRRAAQELDRWADESIAVPEEIQTVLND